MAGLKHLRIEPDGDRFKIVTAFMGNAAGRLLFEAAYIEGDGTGLTLKEAESQARKLDAWIEAQNPKRK